ncbi:hypothetical protein [Brachybacterium saurashtrense]|uniref:hypothetical protein n=1 Tax=Brachybacterium saurashtrense TaxID=556288 RepID=UPI0013B3B980|nr:hypothetical protein [Brachybacterium saurashtrense]
MSRSVGVPAVPPRLRGTPLRPLLAVLVSAALLLVGGAPAALADPAEEPPVPEHAYRAEGPAVSGGGSQAQAPLIVPGIHRDSFARGVQVDEESEEETPGTVKYYRIAVGGGQRVHAAATISAPPVEGGLPEDPGDLGVAVSFLTADGDACDGEWVRDTGESRTADGPITSTVVSGTMGFDGCAGDELFLKVRRTGTAAAGTPLPVEIQVAVEPAGLDGAAPAVTEAIEDDGATPVPPADDQPLEPGRSFATAVAVEPGSYVLEIDPGEVALLRLPVAEGQRLRWRVEESAQPEGAGGLALRVYNPAREQVTVGGGSWTMRAQDPVTGGGMRAPVDLGNRSSDLGAVASAWLPGTHTVVLQRLQRDADDEPAGEGAVTLVLTLEVEGERAEDAAEEPVLDSGETTLEHGPLSSLGIDAPWSRLAMVAGAGALALLGLLTGIAGIVVLRARRR